MDERPQATFLTEDPRRSGNLEIALTVFALHLLQPLARLKGRLRGGLTRGGDVEQTAIQFRASTLTMWRDERESLEITLENLQRKTQNTDHRRGAWWETTTAGDSKFEEDCSEVDIASGSERHAPGKQFLHFRIIEILRIRTSFWSAVSAAMSIGAGLSRAWIPAAYGRHSVPLGIRVLGDVASATNVLRET